MFGQRITLFKLLGFEIRIDLSWLIIAILITWSLAQGVFPLYHKGLSSVTYWWMGAVGALGLFASIIFHELSHSIVARRYGLQMKGITLFIFGGVAEMNDEPSTPKSEFFMAIAGPLASVGIGFLFLGIAYVGKRYGCPISAVVICNYLSSINLLLAAFNLLPAFPLDGGRVFRSILWKWKGDLRWATKISSNVGSGFGLTLIIVGIFFVFSGSVIGGIWWAMIGLFLRSASRMSYQSVLVRNALEGEPVSRFMKTNPVTVTSDISVDHLVKDFIYRYHYKLYPVLNDSKPLSCITTRDIKQIPREEWKNYTVSQLAKPSTADNTITVDEDAVKAIGTMNRTGNSRLMVIDKQGKLSGIIALKDLLRFLSLKLDLEENELEQFEDKES
jgi:Zn-dependent protease/CBS domain-containing protein